MKNFEKFGIQIPKILLPKNMELETWAVVACDQYTQDEAYWKNAEKCAEGKISTLNLIFPEAFLADKNKDARISKIHETMKKYIADGVFCEETACIYIERKTEFARTRRGLVLAVDLENYEWNPQKSALIRATEATVPERIPPRMEIRHGAALELPHIMLLANDEDDLLVGGAEKIAKKNAPLYSGKLMFGAGAISGWSFCGSEAEETLSNAVETLAQKGKMSDGSTFLFAVGDGNHSLATAKAVWDEFKTTLSEEERETSAVRFALVEIVNIFDEGLTFEPIHRLILNHGNSAIEFLQKKLGGVLKDFDSAKSLADFVSKKNASGARFGFASGGKYSALQTEIKDLAIAALQPALDEFLSEIGGKKEDIDYIHGTEETLLLGTANNLAILLPPIAKDSFFQTIAKRGVLPRKSFSMGEASEKRFYVESRRLF